MRAAVLALSALAFAALLLSAALWAPRRFRGAFRDWARRSSRKLICALLLEAGPGLVSREALFRRAGELRQRLEESRAFLLDPGRGLEDILPHGLRILTMRRLVVESARDFTVVEEERPLIEYYRNSLAHFGI
jgi:hypothetical protein